MTALKRQFSGLRIISFLSTTMHFRIHVVGLSSYGTTCKSLLQSSLELKLKFGTLSSGIVMHQSVELSFGYNSRVPIACTVPAPNSSRMCISPNAVVVFCQTMMTLRRVLQSSTLVWWPNCQIRRKTLEFCGQQHAFKRVKHCPVHL